MLCSVTCGNGVEIVSRSCTNPRPKHGGKPCPGEAKKKQPCSRISCPGKEMLLLFDRLCYAVRFIKLGLE